MPAERECLVRVRLFARARDLIGAEAITMSLSEGGTVGDVRRLLAKTHPVLANLLEHSALAVNEELAEDSLPLLPDVEIALLPPVSGG